MGGDAFPLRRRAIRMVTVSGNGPATHDMYDISVHVFLLSSDKFECFIGFGIVDGPQTPANRSNLSGTQKAWSPMTVVQSDMDPLFFTRCLSL